MAKQTKSKSGLPSGFDALRELHGASATGILVLHASRYDDLDVYFMDGQVIACSALGDEWLMGRLLVASGTVSSKDMVHTLDRAGDGSMIDFLMQNELLSMDSLQGIQADRFRDNFHFACVTPWSAASFSKQDAVFPPDMQLGIDTPTLLDEIAEWFEHTEPILVMQHHGQDPVFGRVPKSRLGKGELKMVAQLIKQPTPLSTALALSPLPRYRTLASLAQLVSKRVLAVAIGADGELEKASLTGELEILSGSLETSEEAIPLSTMEIEPLVAEATGLSSLSTEASALDSVVTGPPEPQGLEPPADGGEIAELDEESIAEVDDDDMDEEPDDAVEGQPPADAPAEREGSAETSVPMDADGNERPIDYEKGNVMVYDVLDKVDLSHVDAIPGVESDDAPMDLDNIDAAEIAAAEHSIELGEGSEDLEEGMLDGDVDPELLAPESKVAEPGDGSDSGNETSVNEGIASSSADLFDSSAELSASGEVPPIHLSGTDDSVEFFIDEGEDGQAVVRISESSIPAINTGDLGVLELPRNIPFNEEELTAFLQRIQVFNRIFRVIYESFAEQLGSEATLARFDRFLGDKSLQYPTLFEEMKTSEDGTLAPASLIMNLAKAQPQDHDYFLHEGLYDLIYIHLYDAKDVLSPEGERTMMDEIVAYEEQLHRP